MVLGYQSNGEFRLVFHGARIAEDFVDYFEYLWCNGRRMGETRVGHDSLQKGDIIFNEVHWYGVHEQDIVWMGRCCRVGTPAT